jgi:hypothetical protein
MRKGVRKRDAPRARTPRRAAPHVRVRAITAILGEAGKHMAIRRGKACKHLGDPRAPLADEPGDSPVGHRDRHRARRCRARRRSRRAAAASTAAAAAAVATQEPTAAPGRARSGREHAERRRAHAHTRQLGHGRGHHQRHGHGHGRGHSATPQRCVFAVVHPELRQP